jgi:hypothetical protein
MRTTILTTSLLATLFVFGCDSTNNGGSIMDMAMSMSDDMQPDSGALASCDPTKQECPTGQKCAVVTNMMMAGAACVPDGTVDDGQACTRTMGMDNCKAGLACSRGGGNVCRKLCTDNTGCDQGQSCTTFSRTVSTIGLCAPTCTPFVTTCSGGGDCSATATLFGGTTSTFICRTPGTVDAFGDCGGGGGGGGSCIAGYLCDPAQMWCTPLCDTGSNQCPAFSVDGGAALSCNGNPGYCAAQ